MNLLVKLFLKLVSVFQVDMKKDYAKVRELQKVITPDVKDRYQIFDHEIKADDGHLIAVRTFLPNTERKPGIILFFHGGGWVIGDIETYTPVCGQMADETGMAVYSVDYRLAPEHPFPRGLEDCYTATKFLLDYADLIEETNLQGDLVLLGDSAGANLAAAVSLLLDKRDGISVDKQVLIYPATYWDHRPDSSPFDSVRSNGEQYGLTAKKVQDYFSMYVPDKILSRTEEAAPLVAEDLTGQPESLVLSAEFDPLRDEGEAFGLRLKKAGVKTQIRRILKAPHGFLSYPDLTGGVAETYHLLRQFLFATDENELRSNPEASRPLSRAEVDYLETTLAKIQKLDGQA